ncbi:MULTISPECIES: hypothetical protein [Staphylococcaceae]|uniref:hypothetical protein n=1 Tax=Staphylococcaceae TaxID=90964 RepID=UPI0011B93F6D|nr:MULTISPECIES: hypothetical protein [Macrococcus]
MKYSFESVNKNTFINYLVELASCWAIFIVITGLFMTIYRKYLKSGASTITRKQSARVHAVLVTVLSIPLILLILLLTKKKYAI